MIELLEMGRSIVRRIEQQALEIYKVYRIPFYSQISCIPTHMTAEERELLYEAARTLAFGGVITEVGSYLGASACFLASGGMDQISRLYCIDTWENDAMSEGKWSTFDAFHQNTSPFKNVIVPLRGKSSEMAKLLNEPIDLLFIDGDHSYEGVTVDLKAYLPKVKSGGMLLLHDWGWAEGVQRAIHEIVKPIEIDQPRTLPNLYSVRVDFRKQA